MKLIWLYSPPVACPLRKTKSPEEAVKKKARNAKFKLHPSSTAPALFSEHRRDLESISIDAAELFAEKIAGIERHRAEWKR
jgi:hypothetical protein